FAPMLKKVATGGEFGSGGNGATGGSIITDPALRVPGPPRPVGGWRSARSQLPDRSSLPSGVRGVGASTSTRPCASRGTPGAGYFGHCAGSDTEHPITIMATPEIALLTWTLRLLRVKPRIYGARQAFERSCAAKRDEGITIQAGALRACSTRSETERRLSPARARAR